MDDYEIISEQIGSGAIGKVYIIQKKNSQNIKLIAKIFDNNVREHYENEKYILTKLSDSNENNNNYIILLKNINISIEDLEHNSNYLLFDYLQYGNLSKYLENIKCFTDIPEIYAKLICYKLLKGLKIIHTNEICHNKMDEYNIMFDNEFNPIIIHFSEAYINKDNIFKKDFQGLAKILAKLVTSGKFLNIKVNKKYKMLVIIDNAKREIKESQFWQHLEVKKEFIEFFNLLLKSKIPLNIDDLLNNKWLKEIKDLYNNDNNDNIKKLKEIENNLKIFFKDIYLKIDDFEKQYNKQIINNIDSIINLENNKNNSLINQFIDSYKSCEIGNELFNLEIRKINYEPKGILFDYMEIIINTNIDCDKSDFFYYFMHNLQSNIENIENIKKTIDISEQYLSINVTFEEIKINDEIEINDIGNDKNEINNFDKCDKNDNLYLDDLLIFDEEEQQILEIKIELVKYYEKNEIDKERYFLMFNYIQGEIYDYYHYLNIIKEKAKELLNSKIKK